MSDGVRVSVVGLGTVGQWLIHALHSQTSILSTRYGISPRIVSVGNARDGFIHNSLGLDLPTVLGLVTSGRSLMGVAIPR